MFDRLRQRLRRAPAAAVPAPAAATPSSAALAAGVEALEHGELEHAVALLGDALRAEPQAAEAYRHLCVALFQLGRTAEAQQVIERGLALHPQAAELHFFLANLHAHGGRSDAAIASYREALALEPALAAAHFNLGVVFKDRGEFDAAETCCRAALQADADHAAASKLLGELLARRGAGDEALAAFRRAVAIDPQFADAHFRLALSLQARGQHEEAASAYRQTLALEPRHADASNNLGVLLQQQGQLDAARRAFEQALQIQPGLADAHSNLGGVLQQQRRLDEAIACFRQAIRLNPALAGAFHNLGVALQARRAFDEALTCLLKAMELKPAAEHAVALGVYFLGRDDLDAAYGWLERALALNPESADAHHRIGLVHAIRGELDDAATRFGTALRLKPDHAAACNDLGDVLQLRGDPDAAERLFRKALSIDPAFAPAHHSLGVVLAQRDDPQGALAAFRNSLEHDPDQFHVHMSVGIILRQMGELEPALAAFRRAVELAPEKHSPQVSLMHLQQYLAEWPDLEATARAVRATALASRSSNADPYFPFAFLAMPETSPAQQKRYAEAFARDRFEGLAPLRAQLDFGRRHVAAGKLRVGYLSANLTDHAVGLLIAEVLELHDRERFEFSAYSLAPDDGSPVQTRLRRAFARFVNLHPLSDADAARRIHADGIDVLVDLMGYTAGNRASMLALRPAPVQINYLGYPGTTGASFMDCIIADPFIIPPHLEQHYTEKVMRLPHTYLPRDRTSGRPPAPTRASLGLPEQAVVFCCFNQMYKIAPEVFGLWCRLLRAVPGSVMWMPMGQPRARANLLREAAQHGVDPARLIPAQHVPRHVDHLARLQCADLFLDTFPYNAHTTCSDALWMGVPVVTRAGETFPSRVGGSLLTAIGVPELIAADFDAYYALALGLATDRTRLASVRQSLQARRDASPMFDARRFARDLEGIYAASWASYLESVGPSRPN